MWIEHFHLHSLSNKSYLCKAIIKHLDANTALVDSEKKGGREYKSTLTALHWDRNCNKRNGIQDWKFIMLLKVKERTLPK